MLINSISMKNFQCYFGEHQDNVFNFKLGLNFIIGNNASGKSKIFDAFYWVLYDKIFQSDSREFIGTSAYKEDIGADKAKKLCVIGGTVSVEVILVVKDSQDSEFRITRIYRMKKVDERQWQCDAASKLLIEEFKGANWQSVPAATHASKLERVIPGHLKPYMWFQGEQVDSLIDFRNRTSLMQIINLLSDISHYDDLIKIAAAGSERADSAYSRAAGQLSRNRVESERLEKELLEIRRTIAVKEESRANNATSRDDAQIRIDTLINQIDDAKRRAELKSQRNNAEQAVKRVSDSLDGSLVALNNKLISDYWVLKDAQCTLDEFSRKYDDYYSSHLAKLNARRVVKVDLPLNVPQPIHIANMLEEERCFVCGQEAKRGSNAFGHMTSLLERSDESAADVFTHDCSKFFQNLYSNSLGFMHTIQGINANVEKEFSNIASLRASLQKERLSLSEIDARFDELVAEDQSEHIVNEFRTHTANLKRYTEMLLQDEKELEALNERCKKCISKIQDLVVGAVDKGVVAAKDIFEKLHSVCVSTREGVFQGLLNELEENANEIFQEMTSRNTSITGKLKLAKMSNNTYVPQIVDNDGFQMRGSNDSNIVLTKLAIIMAVVRSKASSSKNYCLITDAPTSKMSKKYSYGFYKALGSQFRQSIVMTYDFVDEEDHDALLELNPATLHFIEASYPGGNRTDRSDLSIQVSRGER